MRCRATSPDPLGSTKMSSKKLFATALLASGLMIGSTVSALADSETSTVTSTNQTQYQAQLAAYKVALAQYKIAFAQY